MDRFTFPWATTLYLPDNRLLQATWVRTERGLRCDFLWRAGHIHDDLLRDLDEYFRHVNNSDAFEVFPERAADPPEFFTNYVRVAPERMPLRTFGLKVRRNHYLFAVRSDMMSAAACAEMNNELLPSTQGALRTRRPATITEPSVDDLLDSFAA